MSNVIELYTISSPGRPIPEELKKELVGVIKRYALCPIKAQTSENKRAIIIWGHDGTNGLTKEEFEKE